MKKMFRKISQYSQENTCARVSFLIKLEAFNYIKKETPVQLFSCEFCEIFKSTFFTIPLWVTASLNCKQASYSQFYFHRHFFIVNHSQWLEIFSKVIQFQPTRGTFPISNYPKWWLTII